MSLAMAGLTATLFVQLASMAGAPLGGWIADSLKKQRPGGRILVQGLAVLAGAPFVVLCGLTGSIGVLVVALTGWGLFKGLYDANIFASAYDVVPVEIRGATAGLMNTVGWLAGGGTAPVVIGWLAQFYGLGGAIALAAVVYVAAGILLLVAVWRYAAADIANAQPAATASSMHLGNNTRLSGAGARES
jgi:MFS family permease